MKQRFRSTGFFVELILTILFFAIACGIIVQIFAKSSLISRRSLDEKNAAAQCQTLCENIRASQSIEAALPKGSYEKKAEDEYQIFYDTSWQPNSENAKVYTLSLRIKETPEPAGKLLKLGLEAKKDQDILYTMEGAQYLQAGEVQ